MGESCRGCWALGCLIRLFIAVDTNVGFNFLQVGSGCAAEQAVYDVLENVFVFVGMEAPRGV